MGQHQGQGQGQYYHNQNDAAEMQKLEPHPDEAAIFDPAITATKNVFRFDPTRQKDMSLPENKIARANEILNKLSFERFEKLSKEFMQVCMHVADRSFFRPHD